MPVVSRPRGGDSAHQRKRAELLAIVEGAARSGAPMDCPRCSKPMFDWQDLDLGHSVDAAVDPNAKGDRIEHRSCNRSAGAELANSRRMGPRRPKGW